MHCMSPTTGVFCAAGTIPFSSPERLMSHAGAWAAPAHSLPPCEEHAVLTLTFARHVLSTECVLLACRSSRGFKIPPSKFPPLSAYNYDPIQDLNFVRQMRPPSAIVTIFTFDVRVNDSERTESMHHYL